MANIVINEVSSNFSFNVGVNNFAGVALPITACWGPAFQDYRLESVLPQDEWDNRYADLYETKVEWMQEHVAWLHFPSTQAGLEAFVATYRGPAAGHRLAQDFSYQMAMSLLVAGYDVWVCRLCPGEKAEGVWIVRDDEQKFENFLRVRALNPGTFGNNIRCEIRPTTRNRRIVWSYTVFAIDVTGVQTAVEHAAFLFNMTQDHQNVFGDTIPHISEIRSRFVEFDMVGRFENGVGEFRLQRQGKRATQPIDLRFDDSHMEVPRNAFIVPRVNHLGQFITFDADQPVDNTNVDLTLRNPRILFLPTGARTIEEAEAIINAGVSPPDSTLVPPYPGNNILSDTLADIQMVHSDRRASMSAGQLVGGTDRRLLRDGDGNPIQDSDGNPVVPVDQNLIDAAGTITGTPTEIQESIEDAEANPFANGLIQLALKHAAERYRTLMMLYPDKLMNLRWDDAIESPGMSTGQLDPSHPDFDLQFLPMKEISEIVEYIGALAARLNHFVPGMSGQEYHVVTEQDEAENIEYMEWLYTNSLHLYILLHDKLNYHPRRIISPGWDDQDFNALDDLGPRRIDMVSPLHRALVDAAYFSRCGVAYIDIPRSAARNAVYRDDADRPEDMGYAQMLARMGTGTAEFDTNAVLYHTNAALFAPWGQFQLAGNNRQTRVPPGFLALLIHRQMLLNQTLQFEWLLPTNRRHNLRIGELDYRVPKKLLRIWQKNEGTGVNVITPIPDMGVTVWGNSTLFEVPPVTYNALQNLSTRWLMNAVRDVVYRCSLAITFQYNNEQAFNMFFAGVTPILDTMRNVGAIEDYLVRMAADINGVDRINANTVIGRVYMVVNGVINEVIVDLVALPPGTDLDRFRA